MDYFDEDEATEMPVVEAPTKRTEARSKKTPTPKDAAVSCQEKPLKRAKTSKAGQAA